MSVLSSAGKQKGLSLGSFEPNRIALDAGGRATVQLGDYVIDTGTLHHHLQRRYPGCLRSGPPLPHGCPHREVGDPCGRPVVTVLGSSSCPSMLMMTRVKKSRFLHGFICDATNITRIVNRRTGRDSTHRIAFFKYRSICGAANVQLSNWCEKCGDSVI